MKKALSREITEDGVALSRDVSVTSDALGV